MPDQLKPCLRCEGRGAIHASLADTYWPECDVCHCQGPTFPTREQAVAWWNERKAEQPDAEPPEPITCDNCPNTPGTCNAECVPPEQPEAEPTRNAKDDLLCDGATHSDLHVSITYRLDALDERCGELWKCVNALEATTRNAKDSPPPGRLYQHHLFCSGDPHYPPGTPGHCCSCVDDGSTVYMRADPEHTRVTKDNPPSAAQPHECPYGGECSPVACDYYRDRPMGREHVLERSWPCGERGHLCDRCQIDMHARLVAGLCLRLDTLNTELATIRLRGPGMHTHLSIGRSSPWYQTPAALAGTPGGQFGSAAFPPWALAEYSFPLPKEEERHE